MRRSTPSNPLIANYADALYFTVTALTTTGFGDITLPGTMGRLISVCIMIFGVSAVLQSSARDVPARTRCVFRAPTCRPCQRPIGWSTPCIRKACSDERSTLQQGRTVMAKDFAAAFRVSPASGQSRRSRPRRCLAERRRRQEGGARAHRKGRRGDRHAAGPALRRRQARAACHVCRAPTRPARMARSAACSTPPVRSVSW